MKGLNQANCFIAIEGSWRNNNGLGPDYTESYNYYSFPYYVTLQFLDINAYTPYTLIRVSWITVNTRSTIKVYNYEKQQIS